MTNSDILLEKSRQYAGKPSQLAAFYDGLQVGNEAKNPDLKIAQEWMDTAKSRADEILTQAGQDAERIVKQAEAKAYEMVKAANQQKAFVESHCLKKLSELDAAIAEVENNPQHRAAKKLMLDLLEQAGYYPDSKGRQEKIPSAVLCHIAVMVAAIAGNNPVSLTFGAKGYNEAT